MKRNPSLFINDITLSCRHILEFTEGIAFDQFKNDEKTLSAVIRKFEVIGEAAKNVPLEIQLRYPDIPWKEMAGMRDRLIHAYFGIDTILVWDTIQQIIPGLLKAASAVAEEIR